MGSSQRLQTKWGAVGWLDFKGETKIHVTISENMWVSVYPSEVEVEMDWKLEDIPGKINTWKKGKLSNHRCFVGGEGG